MFTVLYMHHVSTIGGASYCLLSILKNIDRNVIRPIVLLRSTGPLKNEIEKMGIEVHLFPEMWQVPYNKSFINPHTIRGYFKMYQSLKYFAKWLKNKNIDVIHINTMMLYPYLRIAKENGLKTIIHIREHWPVHEHQIQLRWAQKCIHKYADHIVAINTYSASLFPLSLKKATVIYDWIDMDNRFEDMPMENIFQEDMSKKKTYLFIGGMQKIKGTLEVLYIFDKYINDSDARLLVLGDFAMSFKNKNILYRIFKIRQHLYEKRIISIINKNTHIRIIPATYKLKHLMEQAYCYVSYFTKPHANLTLAECIISGTVSLVKKTEESMEYSYNGKLAILCDDYKDFKNKWINIDKEYNNVKNDIKKHSVYIEEMFSKHNNVNKLNLLYRKICN